MNKKYIGLFIILFLQYAHAQQPLSNSNLPFASQLKSSSNSVSIPLTISNYDQTNSREEKSGYLAVLYSLLLPGMGEWYAGNFDKGKHNLIADGVLWLGFAGLNYYGNWVRDDGRLFAVEHAGIFTTGKDADYFVNVGNFMSISEYNQKKLRDRNLAAVYQEEPTSNYYWKWDSDENRQKFKDTRILSDELNNGSRFVVLALIANRIWSAIHAALMVSDYNESVNPPQSYLPSLKSNVTYFQGRPDGISFTLVKSF